MQVNPSSQRLLFSIVGATLLVAGCAHSNAGRDPQLSTAPPTGVGAIATAQSERAAQVLLDEELVEEFKERVDDYMKLHEKAQSQGNRQQSRNDIGENLVSSQALAMRIRFARHDARPGDIFTAPIAMALRRALDPELRGVAALSARQSIREDAPETFVLAVNADYPEGISRATMPGSVLRILPALPAGLEYRIVDTHLLLMDLDANIVVDYVLDVMCRSC